MTQNKKIALFIDCENISPKYIDIVISKLANYGEVHIRKAYGNWNSGTLKGWNKKVFDFALETVHQLPYCSHKYKNASDIRMTVDIMKTICQNNQIDYVAVATSDSDFTPLIVEIKAQGIEVIGFGEVEKTKAVLQKTCTVFHELSNEKQYEDIKKNKKLISLLKEAIRQTSDTSGYSLVSGIGSYIKNETSKQAKNYGNYKKWGEIFKDLKDVFEIRYRNNNSQMFVKIKVKEY